MKKLLCALFLLLTTPVFAEEVVSVSHKVEDNAIVFDFKIKEGWHILAANPGDIGIPTTIKLEGVDKSFDVWSKAKTFKDDMFVQYGYENNAQYTFVSKSKPHKFFAEISWLACKDDECLPQEKNISYNTTQKEIGFIKILAFAFLGGLILNFMPCIFPILSLKAISLIQSKQKKYNIRIESLLYFIGVLTSFVIMATILMLLRKTGEDLGWGFQLQSPIFIGILIVIFFIIFLMLLDIISLRNPFGNKVGKMSFNKAKIDSFITGFFAVIIASPCTAPFMGIAIGYTINQSTYLYLPIFIAIAVGYALPFCLIGFFPEALHKVMPKSGKWMVVLKKIFAIPIFLTIVWLGWVLENQINHTKQQSLDWQEYNLQQVNQDIIQGKKVLLNFTAKWCITCLANEKIAFGSEKFKALAKEKNIKLYKADWTNKNKDITKQLNRYGRNSVPLYVFYSDGKYKILPPILTSGILEKNL